MTIDHTLENRRLTRRMWEATQLAARKKKVRDRERDRRMMELFYADAEAKKNGGQSVGKIQ